MCVCVCLCVHEGHLTALAKYEYECGFCSFHMCVHTQAMKATEATTVTMNSQSSLVFLPQSVT